MIENLRLQHFRSYRDESFEFSGSVNIIVGPNASGKTNLLESLLVICRGSSYRAADADLVAFTEDWARLDAGVSGGKERIVKIVKSPSFSKSYELDGKVYRRLSSQHVLPVVLFEPNHLLLLAGPPEQRRNYLDDVLEQTEPGYRTLRQQYRRTLAQRNALLKSTNGDAGNSQFFPWNVRLSELAGKIVRARARLVEQLAGEIEPLYRDLSHTATRVSLAYHTPFGAENYESQLLKKLEATHTLDQQRGFTGHGPHREDLVVLFDGHLAAETASRGETRTAVLALKVLELKVLQRAHDTTPLLLLDDVFSELDGARRRALTQYLEPYQTFITTTDADIVLQHFTESSHVIPVRR